VLEIINIHKSFGEQKILQGLDMFLEGGKIHSIVGSNGSGKTTLFNLITAFLRPDIGEIIYKNRRLNMKSPVKVNYLGISRTFQDLRIIKQLTVRDNILLSFKNNPGDKIFNALLPKSIFCSTYKNFQVKAQNILEKTHLTTVQDEFAGEISYGQQKLLTIGCCLANQAEVLLLDEPIAGIDNVNYNRIKEIILKLKSEGRTILLIEHNHKFIEELSDVIWFLHNGKAASFSTFKSFQEDKTVNNVYLK
jgi:ABC-type branched-subunit amino acid transport system ATPase component